MPTARGIGADEMRSDVRNSQIAVPGTFGVKSVEVLMRRRVAGCSVITTVLAMLMSAQEMDVADPEVIQRAVAHADAVVSGRFGTSWCLPWLDGWHCAGALHVKEALSGPWKADQNISFRWVEPMGATCLICSVISRWDHHEGIWFLVRRGSSWELSPAGARWCGGPAPLRSRDRVVAAIRKKKTAN